MIPKKLTLKNFIGIKSGLGRDEIELDFDKLVGDAKLVALIGPNGMGKSTLLDNAHPFRLMPSRAGSYAPGSFSFYDNVFGAEASKELEFEHGKHFYRSTLLFKMGSKTKKAECYLHVRDLFGEWAPARLEDGTVSDGKAETYDRCLEGIIGTPEMFFTSAFAAQNRRSLSSYTNGEIKGLLSELLGLDHIRELGAKSSDVAKGLKLKLDAMRDDLSKLDELEAEREKLDVDMDATDVCLAVARADRTATQGLVEAATRNLANATAQLGASAEVETRRANLTTQITEIKRRTVETLRQIDADTAADKARHTGVISGLRAEITRIQDQIATDEKQVKNGQLIISRKAIIDGATTQVTQAQEHETETYAAFEKAKEAAAELRRLCSERDRVAAQLDAIKQAAEGLKGTCASLHSRSELIDKVPCVGTDLQQKCPLLKEAIKAKGGIQVIEADIAAKRDEYSAMKKQWQEISSQVELMANSERSLKEADENLRRATATLASTREIAAQAPALAQAEQVIADATDRITTNIAGADAKAQEIVCSDLSWGKRLAELEARRANAKQADAKELNGAEAQLALLPPPADTTDADAALHALQEAESKRDQVSINVEQLTARIATQKERLRSVSESLRNAGNTKAKAATIENEIAHWTALTKALGNDGIIALSIDDAGPTLAGLANDLLMSCYGPRFSVSLRTQEETAAGTMKETFDIVVFDADRNDEKSISAMSGGERLWINECLTRAIALYLSQISGHQYGTLFADESDGALDPERKQMFMAMKREVLKLGGYERELFISHSPALWELADAVIDVSKFKEIG